MMSRAVHSVPNARGRLQRVAPLTRAGAAALTSWLAWWRAVAVAPINFTSPPLDLGLTDADLTEQLLSHQEAVVAIPRDRRDFG
jgi:hypothetical protein